VPPPPIQKPYPADAKLIDDGELIAQAEDALRELKTGGAAALEAAVTAIAGGTGAPAPAISDETQRLLASEATGLDAELLEIYLAEAAEVLDTIAAQHRVLHANFGDREALRTVRRQFHTLKGSGRMVGLTEWGELAYDVEKIHTRVLEEDRPVTPAVLALIGIAERDFRRWVDGLKASGRVHADPTQLHAAIRDVEFELPGDRESALEPVSKGTAASETQPTAQSAIASVELPELGSSPAFGGPLVEAPDAHDEAILEVIDVGPVGDAPAAHEVVADATAVREFAGAETSPSRVPADDVMVGDVTVSAALYNILVDEADGHLATLAHEMSRPELDPYHEPSAAMVRASHRCVASTGRQASR
jgi:chemosensory pili system protein ChpA (sensor histidine kinase/response regulator)